MSKFINKGVEIFMGLPPWAKGVVAVGGTAVVAFVGVSVWNKLKNAGERRRLNQIATDAGKELKSLSQRGIRPTITSTQAQGMAVSLVTAFGDCGTDEAAVFRIMGQLKNEADMMLLIQAYGVRKFKGCFTQFFSHEELSLPGAMTYELSSSDLMKVNNILQKAGITFKF